MAGGKYSRANRFMDIMKKSFMIPRILGDPIVVTIFDTTLLTFGTSVTNMRVRLQ